MSIATRPARAGGGACAALGKYRHADSTAQTAGGDPYAAKSDIFLRARRSLDASGVAGRVRPISPAFRVKYEPSNPAAVGAGNVNTQRHALVK